MKPVITMDDKELIRLFQERDERAVAECERQYAAFCRRIAANLLDSPEDVEEILNDVWLAAWQRIPPLVPDSVKAFLGKLVRDISISRFRKERAEKRFSGPAAALDELDDCIPSSFSVEEEIEAEVRNIIDQAGTTGFILGADCSIHPECPDEHIRWMVEAAKNYVGKDAAE